MFFDKKSEIFKELKRILKKIETSKSNLHKKQFNSALKELRKGFLENKKFIKWLSANHSNKIDIKDLSYGSKYLNQLIVETENHLTNLKEHFFNQTNYSSTLDLLEKIEKLVLWEIKADKRFTKQNIEIIQLSQKDIIKKIKKIDKELIKIIEHYGLDDPVNFIKINNKATEKKKFMRLFNEGVIYNPQFTYKPISEKVLSISENKTEDVMNKLRKLNLAAVKGYGYLIEKKRINLQIILKIIRNIGSNKITKESIKLYGFPSNELVKEAYAELEAGKKIIEKKLNSKLDEKRYSAKEFLKKANKFFKENNMRWQTILKTYKDMDGRFKTVNTKQEFWINKEDAPFSERDIIKAIEHEIKVHAFRLESGKKSPLKILAYGTSGYLPTEEGLTTYFEDLKDATNPILQKKKYLYVITEFLAMKKGFYHCFASLLEYGIEPDMAWDVVVRIKRGLSNTSQPGGFFKDHVYFLGDKLIRKFIASGGSAGELLGGKIGLNDLKHLIEKYKI